MGKINKREPTKFYKYMTADVAVSTLKNETLRWSSPLLFNDPFDVPRELSGGRIDVTDIFSTAIEVLEEHILDTRTDLYKFQFRFHEMIAVGRKLTPYDRGAYTNWVIKDRYKNILQIEAAIKGRLKERQEIYREYLPKMRIICMSRKKDITPMWYYYSDKYSGVVIELDANVVPNFGHPWEKLRRVKYSNTFLNFFNKKNQVELLMLNQEPAFDMIATFYHLFKKPDWKYEREYRTMFVLADKTNQLYSDVKFSKECVSEIYFGPKIKCQDREYLIKLISEKFPFVRAYDMEFKLDWKTKFNPI